jgi:hypothetical protein
VRPPQSSVSLSVSPTTVKQDETIALTAPWTNEVEYDDLQTYAPWDAELGVMMFPDAGQECPADVPQELGSSPHALASQGHLGSGGRRDEENPNWVDQGTAVMERIANRPPGNYLLCAYVFRVDFDPFAEPPFARNTVFTHAHSSGTRLQVLENPAGSGNGDATGENNSGGSAASPADSSVPPKAGTAVAGGVALVKGGKALLRMRCVGGGPCRGVAKLVVRQRVKRVVRRSDGRRLVMRVRKVVLGRASFRIPKGTSKVVPVKLKGQSAKLLRSGGQRGVRTNLVGSGLRNRAVVLKQAQTRGERGRGTGAGRKRT